MKLREEINIVLHVHFAPRPRKGNKFHIQSLIKVQEHLLDENLTVEHTVTIVCRHPVGGRNIVLNRTIWIRHEFIQFS